MVDAERGYGVGFGIQTPCPRFVPVLVRHLSRSLLVLALVVGAQAALAGATLAVAPEREGFTVVISPVGPEGPETQGTSLGPQSKPGGNGGGSSTRGYDISYPQCGGPYPANPAFAIVGINGGKVFSVNPCLASQVAWGGGAGSELYANTGNPGPALSSFWPRGQTTPRFCDSNNPDSADCAFDYGFNAAKHSFETALQAYQALGLTSSPSLTRWWLDVEISNSWRSNVAFNIAALQGEIAYLRDVAGISQIGIYSTQAQWNTITGGSLAFTVHPSWVAGGGTLKGAQDRCRRPAFTGGSVVLAQYFYSSFDANVRC